MTADPSDAKAAFEDAAKRITQEVADRWLTKLFGVGGIESLEPSANAAAPDF